MIHIDTIEKGRRKDCTKMETHVQIIGSGEIVKEELKTLLQYARKDDDLRVIVIHALAEVLRNDD